ncbi:hypothetical protein [Mycoplasma sp. VS30B]
MIQLQQEYTSSEQNDAFNNLNEEDKIQILLFVDFLSQVNLEAIGIKNEQKNQLILDLKNELEYEEMKKSLETRKYFYQARSINKRDQFYIQDLTRYLRDAIKHLKKGRKDMLITGSIYPGKSLIPGIGKVVIGLFSLIKSICTIALNPMEIGLSPITIPNNIKNIVEGSIDIHKLTQKEYDVYSDIVQEAIKYIEDKVDEMDKMIEKMLKKNSKDFEDRIFQADALEQIKIWISKFNEMVKDITGIKYQKTLLDNYIYFIDILIWDNYHYNSSSAKSSSLYNPILGDWYDPY